MILECVLKTAHWQTTVRDLECTGLLCLLVNGKVASLDRGAVRGGPITDHVNEFKAFTNHAKYDFSRFTNHDISYNR
jgi:hypothetical protein